MAEIEQARWGLREETATEGMTVEERMGLQTSAAIRNASVTWFIVDGRTGVVDEDRRIAKKLRGLTSRVLVLVNKVDGRVESAEWEDWWAGVVADVAKLGFGEPLPVSGAQGFGFSDLYGEIVEDLESAKPPVPIAEDTSALVPVETEPVVKGRETLEERRARLVREGTISIAIVGRPNVGKSTLVNQLIGSGTLSQELGHTGVTALALLADQLAVHAWFQKEFSRGPRPD